MKQVLVLTSENLSTSENASAMKRRLQETAWMIPSMFCCTSLWLGKGPEDAELKVSETVAGGLEQSQIWAGLSYIILTCPDCSTGHIFMVHKLKALELSAVGYFSCLKGCITHLPASLSQTWPQRTTWTNSPLKKKTSSF